MTIKNETICDECGEILNEGDLIYCETCYCKMGGGLAGCSERVRELENTIIGLKQDLIIARRGKR